MSAVCEYVYVTILPIEIAGDASHVLAPLIAQNYNASSVCCATTKNLQDNLMSCRSRLSGHGWGWLAASFLYYDHHHVVLADNERQSVRIDKITWGIIHHQRRSIQTQFSSTIFHFCNVMYTCGYSSPVSNPSTTVNPPPFS
jgi:hypothetical protein